MTPILGSPNSQFNNFIVFPSQDAPNTNPEGPQYYSPPGLSDDIEGNRYKISYLPVGLEDLVNDASSWAARGIFRYRPADIDMDWQLIAHGGRVDELSPLGQSIPIGAFINGNGTRGYLPAEIGEQFQAIKDGLVAGGATTEEADVEAPRILANSLARNLDTRPYHGDYDRTGRTKVDSYGTSLRGDWELESGHVTSISSYEFYDVEQSQDFDFMPIVVLENFLKHEAWQFVQSLDWQDELEDEPFRWGVGAYFLMDELDYEQDQVTAPGISPLFRPYVQKTWSANIGATFSWDFLDDFTLEGGVRYNWERKKMDVNGFTIGETAVCRPEVDLVSCVQQYTYDAPTGELTLRYHFNEDVSSYLKYTHGWKGAQLNAGTARSLGDEPISAADPETIDAFEIGLHGEWFDGRASLDLSLFHYTYENYQVFIIKNDYGSIPQRVVINANDAVYYGAEANIVVSPVENLNLVGRFGWNESEFLDFTRQQIYAIAQPGNNPPEAISVNLNYTGNQLPNAPKFKISATADYTLELGRYGSLIPRYDLSWTDDVYFDASEGRGDPNTFGGNVFPEFAIGQPAYLLHAARLTWRSPTGNIEVAGWGRNLSDEVYKVYAFNAQAIGFVGNFVGQPRTYGVSLLINW